MDICQGAPKFLVTPLNPGKYEKRLLNSFALVYRDLQLLNDRIHSNALSTRTILYTDSKTKTTKTRKCMKHNRNVHLQDYKLGSYNSQYTTNDAAYNWKDISHLKHTKAAQSDHIVI